MGCSNCPELGYTPPQLAKAAYVKPVQQVILGVLKLALLSNCVS